MIAALSLELSSSVNSDTPSEQHIQLTTGAVLAEPSQTQRNGCLG